MIKSIPMMAPLAFLAAAVLPASAGAERLADPLGFWEGRTESVSTVKIIAKKPFRSRAVGRGKINPDGSLDLIQRVEDEGRPTHERHWKIRKVGPNRYTGTMSEAKGPVSVDEVDGKFRFRFKMPGNLAVEQWLTPLPGGKSASNKLTIKKLGVKVGSSEGTIRKLN